MTSARRVTSHPHNETATIRISDDAPDHLVRLEISTTRTGDMVHSFTVERVTFIDARKQPEVFWRNIARRMDDAYNAGEPLWSRLTPAEIDALNHDGVDTVPESASGLGAGGREAHDPRVRTTW